MTKPTDACGPTCTRCGPRRRSEEGWWVMVHGYKARPKGEAAWAFVMTLDEVKEYIDNGEAGQTWEVECFSMPQDQFDEMGEFDGW